MFRTSALRWSRPRCASAPIDEALGTHGSTLLFGAGDTDEDDPTLALVTELLKNGGDDGSHA